MLSLWRWFWWSSGGGGVVGRPPGPYYFDAYLIYEAGPVASQLYRQGAVAQETTSYETVGGIV